MNTDSQVGGLLPFLLHPSPQVVSLAVVNLLPFTVSSSPQRHLFLDQTVGPDQQRQAESVCGSRTVCV
ncbi:hypothetical protein P389DRAFT_24066 [Cystobasidium minutum MCA 4210]|uniref:uncharacterized protein n=1 Tax=Cystobasidium minutum MCA 4210 TaxID=1397322 RepID=UPI0034CF56C4|eukprot:jgi/Rhomi1/24066/CE24065_165